jgi:hypothetical protein
MVFILLYFWCGSTKMLQCILCVVVEYDKGTMHENLMKYTVMGLIANTLVDMFTGKTHADDMFKDRLKSL